MFDEKFIIDYVVIPLKEKYPHLYFMVELKTHRKILSNDYIEHIYLDVLNSKEMIDVPCEKYHIKDYDYLFRGELSLIKIKQKDLDEYKLFLIKNIDDKLLERIKG